VQLAVEEVPATMNFQQQPQTAIQSFPHAKAWLSRAQHRLADGSARCLQAILPDRAKQSAGILMYHRICEPVQGVEPPTFSVSPRRFRRQLTGLLERGYTPLPLRSLLTMQRTQQPIPPRSFAITFDDGYENNLTQALPVLQELQAPATFFIATGYTGSADPFPFDNWKLAGTRRMRADSWRPLSRRQCEQMLKSPLVDIGSHTHMHTDYRADTPGLLADLQQSAEQLGKWYGIRKPLFAFPYGSRHLGFSGGAMSAAAREAGMQCALTTESELVNADTDPFEWGRFTAESYDTPASLVAKLAGWYHPPAAVLRKLRQRLQRRPR